MGCLQKLLKNQDAWHCQRGNAMSVQSLRLQTDWWWLRPVRGSGSGNVFHQQTAHSNQNDKLRHLSQEHLHFTTKSIIAHLRLPRTYGLCLLQRCLSCLPHCEEERHVDRVSPGSVKDTWIERHGERVRLERWTCRAPDAQPRSSCFPVYREHPGSPGSFGGRYDIAKALVSLEDVGTERMRHFRNSNPSSQSMTYSTIQSLSIPCAFLLDFVVRTKSIVVFKSVFVSEFHRPHAEQGRKQGITVITASSIDASKVAVLAFKEAINVGGVFVNVDQAWTKQKKHLQTANNGPYWHSELNGMRVCIESILLRLLCSDEVCCDPVFLISTTNMWQNDPCLSWVCYTSITWPANQQSCTKQSTLKSFKVKSSWSLLVRNFTWEHSHSKSLKRLRWKFLRIEEPYRHSRDTGPSAPQLGAFATEETCERHEVRSGVRTAWQKNREWTAQT